MTAQAPPEAKTGGSDGDVLDLVTQRDHTSSYSFLNYLNDRGRLSAFINLQTFTPSRREFHDYLPWAACRLSPLVLHVVS